MQKFDNKKKSIKENLRSIFYAVFAALLIRSFLYEPFSIPSGSMYPNLMVGDYLFVSKFSYGFSKVVNLYRESTLGIIDMFSLLIISHLSGPAFT